jgi:uncharacterized cofD-like protein
MKDKSFVIIGGGTGTFSVLTGLKKYTDNITAVVSMADSGGSAKKERDEWGLLPSSDIRKSLLALADISTENSMLLRKLFQYRYNEGKGLKGMTFGNLFLVALTKLLGSQKDAIEKAGEILNIRGRVLPASMDSVNLVAEYEDSTIVTGEHFIDEPKHNGKLKIKKLYTQPKAIITDETKDAIKKSDCIIIGPGGFYTTILANLVVNGMVEAIQKSKAVKIFVLNLMTEYGQTYGFSVWNFIDELNKYLSVDSLDYVLINNNVIPDKILKKYKKYHAEPVINDLDGAMPFKIITADLLSKKLIKQEKGDILKRSLIRHNGDKIARECIKLVKYAKTA